MDARNASIVVLVKANIISIVRRGCSVGKGPDELASQRKSGDMGKEPRHNNCVSILEAGVPRHTENVPNMHVCSENIAFGIEFRYVCMVITFSRVWINRVRLPILLVVS